MKNHCPICQKELDLNPRYPNAICADCAKEAKSEDGRPLEFFNQSLSGGFSAFYADSKEKYDSHICFVKGVKCRADEARFGGIVIERCITFEERIRGGIVGLLVGDALGVPYEFHERQSIPPFDEIEFEPPEYFRRAHSGVPVGTWSDDGAQALILLNTLLECDKFDASHFAKGLVDWYNSGFMAVGGKVFDVGIQTSTAIRELKRGVEPLLAGGKDEYSNGNGALMRVLPLALWHQGSDLELIADAFDQSAVTHGHLRSKLCCALYCLWARLILQNVENPWKNAVETLYKIFPEGTPENVELENHILPNDDIFELKGSGYVVDSLRSARWANNNKTFEETVKAAISLGEDTDTTACIAGGIAGLKFGIHGIPNRWRENLRGKDIYELILEKLIANLL